MGEYYKEKVKSLTSLRSNLFTCVIVLTGGVIGLFFLDAPLPLRVIFIIIGMYFGIIFLLNLLSINDEIDRNLEELKK